MRWLEVSINVSNFRPGDLLVSSRKGYELYHNPRTGKGWIMQRLSFDWYIYGPYNYEHVRNKYNSL